MAEKVGIIIQARMASTRLPKKIMINLADKPVLWHVVERCKKTRVDKVIIATSTNNENDKIEEFCIENGYDFFRGSEEDVLNRYFEAAKKFELDIVIRITSDCPLIDPETINNSLEEFKQKNIDYLGNLSKRSFPRGLDVEVFSFSALEKANALAKEKPYREHVTAFIYSHPELFNIGEIIVDGKLNRPDLRLCIDTHEDLTLLKSIYDVFYKSGKIVPIEGVIDFLDKNPELARINLNSEKEHLERNEKQNVRQTFMKSSTDELTPRKSILIKTKSGHREIGPGKPVFIVAEMSGNHNQSFEKAIELIDAAAKSGVDAIKIQTYTPDTLTIDCDNEYFQVKVNESWKGKKLYDLYKEAYTPWDWQPRLKEYAESKGIIFFSTPFDETAVDFLEEMNVPLYKVASFEIGHLQLLKKIGKTKKPVILSRGLASVEEIELAIKTLKESGSEQIAVLQCVSSYPAKPEQMNLLTIKDIGERFGVISGLSDHSLGNLVSLISIGVGASIIEKHFTISRKEKGPDSEFSLEPKELEELVKLIREGEKAIGKPSYETDKKESENLIFKRSIFAVKDIKKGEKISLESIKVIRPGYGIAPKYFEEIIGKNAKNDIKRGTPIKWEFIENGQI